jgi:hypothetical protein
MKKIAIFILTIMSIGVSAQSTTPRTGTAANVDNTYRKLNFKFVAPTDATGNDTVTLTPNAFHTMIRIASLTDSITVYIPSVALSFAGDEIEITCVNSSGSAHAIKWGGAYIAPATTTTGGAVGTVYLASTKRAVISLVFDGVKWTERYRMVQ